MAIDLTKLSNEELIALQSGDLGKLSDQTLKQLDTSLAEQEGPSIGQMAAGAGVEVGAGVAGEVAGLALAPFTAGISYPVAKFTTGVAGSIAAQTIEEKPEISYGRALAAGLMNLIPGASLGKGVKVGAMLGKEAARGAAIGAGEATVTSMIDEQRLPTATELGAYVAGGALGGAAVGGALKGGKELVAAAKPSEIFSSLGKFGQKVTAAAAPSKVLGSDIQDVVIGGKNTAASMAEVGGRVSRQVDEIIAKQANPTVAAQELNDYLDGKITALPKYLESLSGDVDIAREKIKEVQQRLVANIDANYTNASPELKKKIEDSIASGNYLTKEYRFFTDKDWNPTKKQVDDAISELATDYLSSAAAAGKSMSLADAEDKAKNYLNELNKKKLSIIKNEDYYPSSIDGFLKERKDIGKALSSYLGEITDPGERLRGTLTRVARGVYRDETDGRIIDILAKRGLISSNPTDELTAELKLRKFTPQNKLYVSPVVQDALNEIYVSKGADETSNMLIRGLSDVWNTAVGASKAVKVLFNPPSYMVQIYSNMANLAGMAVNPFGSSSRALRVALSEFGPIEQLTKNPVARKALLDDIAEATKYGIKGSNILDSDIRTNIERGLFTESLQKGLGVFSKAYTVADNAGRYIAWKSNQKMLNKLFPNSDSEAVKQFAASLTNDTYQNYDRLSSFGKYLTRIGVMPQFAAFTMEFARNQYNQGRIIKQMLDGSFGAGIAGIKLPTKTIKTASGVITVTDNSAMRMEGLKRLAALSAVYGSTYAVIDAINQKNNVSKEKEAALKETVLGDWESNNKLAVVLSEDGKSGKYMNPSYIIPHSVAISALDAGLNDQPISAVSSMLANELVGEGSFIGRSVYASLFNVDPRTGKPISYQTDKAKNVADRVAFAINDAFMPGVARETEKLGKALRGEGELAPQDVLKRQIGVRVNDFKIEDGAKMRIRTSVDNAKLASADYNAARDYRQLAPAQLEVVYQNANSARMDALNKIGRHVGNLRTLGMDDDSIAKLLKDTGLSNKDILGVFTNTIDALPREKVVTASEVYDKIKELPKSQQGKAIADLAKSDVGMYRKVIERQREESRLQVRGVGTMDKLMLGLNVDDGERAKFINRSSANMTPAEKQMYLNDLRVKKILTPKVEVQLKVYN